MSFISPLPCDSGSILESCCLTPFPGFCLIDGTPIAILMQDGIQVGWTNLTTGVFTPGPPPLGTQSCGPPEDCCPLPFTGFCLEDGTPIAIIIESGVQTGWVDLTTGIFTPGSPPAGTGICPAIPVSGTVDTRVLDCNTDSITVCQGTIPWSVEVSGTVPIVGSYTPSDNQINPIDLVGTEGFTMVWGPGINSGLPRWSRWGAYGIDDDITSPRVPGVAIFGRPELGFGEVPQQAGVVSPISPNHEAFHALRVVSSDLYRPGSSPISQRQSDGEVDTNLPDNVGIVAPTVFNGTTFDRLRGGGDDTDNQAAVSLGLAKVIGRTYIWDGANWDRWTGTITVGNTVVVDTNFDYAEDSVHVSGDIGAFILGVRNDSGAALTSADGDYSPIATDSAGRVGITDLGGSITVDAVDLDIRNLDCTTDDVTICMTTGTATNGTQVSTAGAGAVSILAANANRKSALITNITTLATVRIGVSGVTATTGIARLLPGDILVLTMPYCPDEELFMIREGAVDGTVLVSEVT